MYRTSIVFTHPSHKSIVLNNPLARSRSPVLCNNISQASFHNVRAGKKRGACTYCADPVQPARPTFSSLTTRRTLHKYNKTAHPISFSLIAASAFCSWFAFSVSDIRQTQNRPSAIQIILSSSPALGFASVQDITRTMPPITASYPKEQRTPTKSRLFFYLLHSPSPRPTWESGTQIGKTKYTKSSENKRILHIYYSPLAFNSSGTTRSVRSGSSPYQKIHSSLAAVRESGGCTTLLGMS